MKEEAVEKDMSSDKFIEVYLAGSEDLKKPPGYNEYKFIKTVAQPSILGKAAFGFLNLLYRYNLLAKE